MQIHLHAMRNNNSKMFNKLEFGANTGFGCVEANNWLGKFRV